MENTEFTSGILSNGKRYSVDTIKYGHIHKTQLELKNMKIKEEEKAEYFMIILVSKCVKIDDSEIKAKDVMEMDVEDAMIIIEAVGIQFEKLNYIL